MSRVKLEDHDDIWLISGGYDYTVVFSETQAEIRKADMEEIFNNVEVYHYHRVDE